MRSWMLARGSPATGVVATNSIRGVVAPWPLLAPDEVCSNDRRRDAAVLRDLAAALARSGDVEQAAATAREVIELPADSTGLAARALREGLRQDLASYGADDPPSRAEDRR